MVRLHLGCGPKDKHWDGYINCDLLPDADVVCDLRKLPFEEGYADEITAIHVFEHFEVWEASDVAREWFRVLKPGGRLVLELPDLDKCIDLYTRKPIYPTIRGGRVKGLTLALFGLYGDWRENRPEMTHKWCWTNQMLAGCLSEAGFREIKSMEPKFHYKMRDMRVEALK